MVQRSRFLRGALCASALLALAPACTNPTANGSASVCYRAEGAPRPEQSPDQDAEFTHRGVRLASPEEETEAPEDFEGCAQGQAVAGELIDEDGVHFWLGVDAVLGGRNLLVPELFTILDGAEVVVRQARGWNFRDTAFITRGEQPILLLQSGAALEGDHGALVVEDAGGDALPAVGPCGTTTSHSLRFVDDNGAQGAGNGATVQLMVGGVEFLGHNLFSVEYDTRGCTDGPWPANQASWVAHDNSL